MVVCGAGCALIHGWQIWSILDKIQRSGCDLARWVALDPDPTRDPFTEIKYTGENVELLSEKNTFLNSKYFTSVILFRYVTEMNFFLFEIGT